MLTAMAKKAVFNLFAKIQIGKIIITDETDNHKQYEFSSREKKDPAVAHIRIKHQRAYRCMLIKGSLGAAESYMAGDWGTDDLMNLLIVFNQNAEIFEKIENPLVQFLQSVRYWISIFLNQDEHNIVRSKKNILLHYDLGNDFFKTFLDPLLMYSCALYDPPNSTLEEASKNKLAFIAEKLQLKSSDHLLEIGTGWGGLAIALAQHTGCKVTTTTISDKQYAYVKSEINRLGLNDKIELLNKDYRELSGQYDKLVSVEMIEAVGARHLDKFIYVCDKLLKPSGLFFLQAIVINDQDYEAYKKQIDFIKKYIFPGGCLPSIAAISEAVKKVSRLQLIYLQDIGEHYVRTVQDWRSNFSQHQDIIKAQGFSDKFIRMWDFYLCACIAGFLSRRTSDIHTVWRKR